MAHCQSPKGVGVGGHAVKTNQMAPANPGLKAASQSASGVGAMLKTKSKRERSVSVDSVEPRDALASALEAEAKAGEPDRHTQAGRHTDGQTHRRADTQAGRRRWA